MRMTDRTSEKAAGERPEIERAGRSGGRTAGGVRFRTRLATADVTRSSSAKTANADEPRGGRIAR